jgi:hypothetical protein
MRSHISAYVLILVSDAVFLLQVIANCLLLLTANLLGLTSYYLADKQQRRAFLETRQSLEMKLVIEEQSAEQVCTTRGQKFRPPWRNVQENE